MIAKETNGDFMKEQKKPLVIRLTAEMREWLDCQSGENGRTVNGEIVFRLRKMMEQEMKNERQSA